MARLPQDDIEDANIKGANIEGANIEDNAEQQDEGQAQDVAQDAMDASTDLYEDSDKPDRNDPTAVTPDDVPDLVDKMNEMVRSGHIDNGAYEGEPMMDDEEDYLGRTDDENDDDL